MLDNFYKFNHDNDDRKKVVLEFCVNNSIEHAINDESSNDQESHIELPQSLDEAISNLSQGKYVWHCIEYLHLYIYHLYQNKLFNDLDLVVKTSMLNFVLPYATIESEYPMLNRTLRILYQLSCCDQNEDSPFQNYQFAESITEIIGNSEDMSTIRKLALKLVNNLLIDDTIGNNIFHNLIQARIPSVILSSNIIEQDNFNKLMDETKGRYFKVVAKTAELLGHLANYCKDEYLKIFASFFNDIAYFISNDFSKIDKKDSIRCNFLYLLSIMMICDTNRDYAYSLQILDIIIDNILYHKDGDLVKYSYDIIYQIARNDGMHPSFQTNKFYNLTCNAIQCAKSVSVISSIFNAIGAILPYDFQNLWENDVMSNVYFIYEANKFKFKLEAARLIIRFFEVSSEDPSFFIDVLQNSQYLQNVCLSIESFSNDDMLYFLDVINLLVNNKFLDISDEIRKCDEIYDVLDSMKNIENEEISFKSEELLSIMKDQDEE